MSIGFKMPLQAFIQDLHRHSEAALARAGEVPVTTLEAVKEHIEVAMHEPKSGVEYHRAGGRVHVASAPGEAPAIDTAALIGSGRIERTGRFSADLIYDDPAALPMELGAPARGIAPRPFLGPAMEQERELFFERVKEALDGNA